MLPFNAVLPRGFAVLALLVLHDFQGQCRRVKPERGPTSTLRHMQRATARAGAPNTVLLTRRYLNSGPTRSQRHFLSPQSRPDRGVPLSVCACSPPRCCPSWGVQHVPISTPQVTELKRTQVIAVFLADFKYRVGRSRGREGPVK